MAKSRDALFDELFNSFMSTTFSSKTEAKMKLTNLEALAMETIENKHTQLSLAALRYRNLFEGVIS